MVDRALAAVLSASAGVGESLTELLAGGRPQQPGLIVPDSAEVLTYAQVASRVEALAQRLADLTVRRGDRVALALPNGPDIVLLLLAITALGAAAAPLNPAYTEAEFGFFLDDIAPRLLLIPASGNAAASAAAATAGTALVGVRPDGDGPPRLLYDGGQVGSQRSFEPGDADDVAVVLHTSGTTSRPKQVPLRQRNLMASARTIAAHYRLGSADVSFCVMPLFHIHGLVASTFAALGSGGAVIAPRRFTPSRFWPQAREHGTTWLSAGPTLHQMILDKADANGAPDTLRFVRSCSSALSPALLARADLHTDSDCGRGRHLAAGRQRRGGRHPGPGGDVRVREQPGRHGRGVLWPLVPHRGLRGAAR